MITDTLTKTPAVPPVPGYVPDVTKVEPVGSSTQSFTALVTVNPTLGQTGTGIVIADVLVQSTYQRAPWLEAPAMFAIPAGGQSVSETVTFNVIAPGPVAGTTYIVIAAAYINASLGTGNVSLPAVVPADNTVPG
jgi:hypothetical protein